MLFEINTAYIINVKFHDTLFTPAPLNIICKYVMVFILSIDMVYFPLITYRVLRQQIDTFSTIVQLVLLHFYQSNRIL